MESAVQTERLCVEHACEVVLAELVAQAESCWLLDSSPLNHAWEVLQMEDEVDNLESSEQLPMEEIDLQAELLLDVESSVVEAALVHQSLEVPCQSRNLLASAFP